MSIDIQYLLWLQELRNATGGMFDEFFNALSKFAVDILPFLPYIIYWGASKKWGYRFMTSIWCAEMMNGIIKLTVCAYRPWIRSELIEPAGDSKVAATGYSFPSGHSTVATTLYGSVVVWQRERRGWLAAVCAGLLVLTCFSRNFLGVHTPQDVVVGFSSSVLLIFIIGIAEKKVGDNEKLKDMLTLLGIVSIILTIIYIKVKPYPMDYVDGALLVDPNKMMNDTFKACGGFLGFLIGSYVDRHYLNYEIPEGKAASNLPMLTAIGAGILFAWKEWFAPATIVPMLGGHWGNFIGRALMTLFALVIWPVVILNETSKRKA
ncbi:PAP2 superfamily protein [Lachnospiraceae bacterium]|nr:PAP2 superfamily protein [Lachnospiraceae bacterium]